MGEEGKERGCEEEGGQGLHFGGCLRDEGESDMI